MTTIHHPYFAPWIGYFVKWQVSDTFVFLDDVLFRRDHLKRSKLCQNSGKSFYISVACGKQNRARYADVRLSTELDHAKAIRTVEHNYGRSEHFKETMVLFEEFFHFFKAGDLLLQANVNSIKFLGASLGISQPRIKYSSEFAPFEERTNRVIKICSAVDSTDLLIGDGSMKNVHDLVEIQSEGINIKQLSYFSNHLVYAQNHTKKTISNSEFIPGLSVFDALFNVGKPKLLHHFNEISKLVTDYKV